MEALLKIVEKIFFPKNEIEELQVGSIYHAVLKNGRSFTGTYIGYDELTRRLMFHLCKENIGFFISLKHILMLYPSYC
jgi:hypothetical protein